MEVIYKYQMALTDSGTLSMPALAKLLKVSHQGEDIFVWAQVNPRMIPFEIEYKIYGTGHEIKEDENFKYFDTVFMPNGLVWHVFFNTK